MKPATLKALKRSIAHWKRLATGKERDGEEIGPECCSLCMAFQNKSCDGCPVAMRTGLSLCRASPWGKAFATYTARIDKNNPDAFKDVHEKDQAFRSAAKEELAFLKSLLPKKPRKKATK